VAGPGSGLSKSIIIFKKNKKKYYFSKKTKINGLQLGLTGSTGLIGLHQVFSSFIFLQPGPVLAPERPGPGSAGSRIDPSGRTGFQNYNMDAR
jgi:hypothetical protein